MIGPHHVMTWGTSDEAVVGTAGGGAFVVRRKRWMTVFVLLVALLC